MVSMSDLVQSGLNDNNLSFLIFIVLHLTALHKNPSLEFVDNCREARCGGRQGDRETGRQGDRENVCYTSRNSC